MSKTVLLTVLVAGLFILGTAYPVWAAQLDARLDPNSTESPVKLTYQKTLNIDYSDGGQIRDLLQGKTWDITGTQSSPHPDVQRLIDNLNFVILDNGSNARISDLQVDYKFVLTGRDASATIDYQVILGATLADYVITQNSQQSLVDVGWRGLSATGNVPIDGIEMNIPLDLIKSEEPEVYDILAGTEAVDILSMNLLNADFILEQPLSNWHFLFDPTGVNADAATFGLDDSISGFVVSTWTMGESSFREGIQTEIVNEVTIVADQTYHVKTTQAPDQGNLYVIGFGALDKLDDLEILGVTPTPPEGVINPTGQFPVFIIYGMAGVAAVGGVAFFIYSNRALKKENQGQQGIAPDQLVGYQTSSSAGGYQTNRGEAQLRDESDYSQTRSVYEGTASQQTPPPTATVQEDATCGCSASLEMGSECDCAMQGSCLCDATCNCNDSLCQEQAHSMR